MRVFMGGQVIVFTTIFTKEYLEYFLDLVARLANLLCIDDIRSHRMYLCVLARFVPGSLMTTLRSPSGQQWLARQTKSNQEPAQMRAF